MPTLDCWGGCNAQPTLASLIAEFEKKKDATTYAEAAAVALDNLQANAASSIRERHDALRFLSTTTVEEDGSYGVCSSNAIGTKTSAKLALAEFLSANATEQIAAKAAIDSLLESFKSQHIGIRLDLLVLLQNAKWPLTAAQAGLIVDALEEVILARQAAETLLSCDGGMDVVVDRIAKLPVTSSKYIFLCLRPVKLVLSDKVLAALMLHAAKSDEASAQCAMGLGDNDIPLEKLMSVSSGYLDEDDALFVSDKSVNRRLKLMLRQISSERPEDLVTTIEKAGGRARVLAIWIAGLIDDPDPKVVEAVEAAAKDDDDEIASAASEAVERIRKKGASGR